MTRRISRAVLRGASLAVALAVLAAPAAAQTPPQSTLVVAALGGQLGTTVKKIFEPFERQHNVTIRWSPGASAENVAKVAATKANPEYDIAFGDNMTHYSGETQDLWAPIDESIVTNFKDLYPVARTRKNSGVGFGFFYAGLFYRPDVFEKNGWPAPTGWNDLFRPALCGKVGLMEPAIAYTVHMLIMLSGGDAARVQEGIKTLSEHKKCIPVLEPTAAKLEEKVQLGEYVLGVHGNIRVIPLMQRGYPVKFAIPKEGSVVAYSTASPVKNSPNARLAQEFVNWLIRPEIQAVLMEDVFYGPTNAKVAVPDRLRDLGVPDQEAVKKLVVVSDETVFEKRREWIRQLERAMAR